MKIDVSTQEGRDLARIWIKNNETKLPSKLDGGHVYYNDVKKSMMVILDSLDAYEEGSVAFESALTNWKTINNFLADKSRWNREMNERMKAKVEASERVHKAIVVDKKEEKKKARARNEITRHIEIVEAAGAYVDDENLSITIPEGVSLMSVKKSLDYLRKKKFITQRVTFKIND